MKLDRHFFHVFHALILSHWLLTVTHLKHISQTNLISVIIASPPFCSSAVCRSLHLQLHSCASLNSELKFFTSVFTAFSEKKRQSYLFLLKSSILTGTLFATKTLLCRKCWVGCCYKIQIWVQGRDFKLFLRWYLWRMRDCRRRLFRRFWWLKSVIT